MGELMKFNNDSDEIENQRNEFEDYCNSIENMTEEIYLIAKETL